MIEFKCNPNFEATLLREKEDMFSVTLHMFHGTHFLIHQCNATLPIVNLAHLRTCVEEKGDLKFKYP